MSVKNSKDNPNNIKVDNYKAYKISFKQIIKEKYKQKINETVYRLNNYLTHTYQFLRLWILELYETKSKYQ